jgi:hypothetical protein
MAGLHERFRAFTPLAMALLWLGLAIPARAQVAATVFTGGGDDRIVHRTFLHFGAAVEFRPHWIGGVLRLSATWTPEQHDYRELYGEEEEPVQRTWLALTERERTALWSAHVDLRLPFGDTLNSNGLYKGTYVFAGLGYARRMFVLDRWEQDGNGQVSTFHFDERYGTLLLRAGFGGEWNFKWGCPFIEGFITAGSAHGTQGISFPNTIGLSLGYRFTTAVLKKESPGE